MLPTSTYPMWYNAIPLFGPLNHSLYLAYSIGTKGFNPSIFRNYTGYVPRYVYRIPKQPIVPPAFTPHIVGKQFLTVVQPVISMDIIPTQQPIIIPHYYKSWFLKGSNWLTCHFLLMDMCTWLKAKGLNDTCICWLINLTIAVYLTKYT